MMKVLAILGSGLLAATSLALPGTADAQRYGYHRAYHHYHGGGYRYRHHGYRHGYRYRPYRYGYRHHPRYWHGHHGYDRHGYRYR